MILPPCAVAIFVAGVSLALIAQPPDVRGLPADGPIHWESVLDQNEMDPLSVQGFFRSLIMLLRREDLDHETEFYEPVPLMWITGRGNLIDEARRLALKDAQHTNPEGRNEATAEALGEDFALGEATRFDENGDPNGTTAFVQSTEQESGTPLGRTEEKNFGLNGYYESKIAGGLGFTSLGIGFPKDPRFTPREGDEGEEPTFVVTSTSIFDGDTKTGHQLDLHTFKYGEWPRLPLLTAFDEEGNAMDCPYGISQPELLAVYRGGIAGTGRRLGEDGEDRGRYVFYGFTTTYADGDGSTFRAGLTGGIYRSPNPGREVSDLVALGDGGHLIGTSEHFTPGGGQSAWFHDSQPGGESERIGLWGDDRHTGDDGAEISEPVFLSGTGHAAGISQAFDSEGFPFAVPDQSAWHFHPETGTHRIGLTGEEHTRDDGRQSSSLTHGTDRGPFGIAAAPPLINNRGLVAGQSARFIGTTFRGQSAWIYDPDSGTTAQLGFTDEAHTDANGTRESVVTHLNESGRVAGRSRDYTGDFIIRYSVWYADPLPVDGEMSMPSDSGDTVIRIGLLDEDHTGDDGQRNSQVELMNAAGQMVGNSDRYNGNEPFAANGGTAWFLDPDEGRFETLGVPTRADGWSVQRIAYFGEDGVVLGSYNAGEGSRAFLWDPHSGFVDLTDSVTNLEEHGFVHLFAAVEMSDDGLIFGRGMTIHGEERHYLLAAVSDPGGALTYALWASEIPDPALRPPLAAAAGDGAHNLVRYGTGAGPLEPVRDHLPLVAADESGQIRFLFARDSERNDVVTEVQVTDDLPGNWTTLFRSENGEPFEPVGDAGGAIVETPAGGSLVNVQVALDGQTGFARLRFNLPPP